MKEFTFWDEDDLSNLPKDFRLVPFNVAFINAKNFECPSHKKRQKKTVGEKRSDLDTRPGNFL